MIPSSNDSKTFTNLSLKQMHVAEFAYVGSRLCNLASSELIVEYNAY